MTGTLYIVATPIGNLEDITLRALRILKESDLILAEDTRKSSILLKYYEIDIPTLSYHQHSGEQKKLEILKLLMDGKNLSLITDAGTPGISDPANELIAFLLANDPEIKIVPIPGPSAIITALSISAINVNRFVFLGFMPKKKKEKLFEWLKEGKVPFAYYDSPFRVIKNLEDIKNRFGEDIKVFVARELTKIHESVYRGTISEVITKMQKDTIKGEIVVVVN